MNTPTRFIEVRVVAITHSAESKGGLFVSWLKEAGHEIIPWSIRERGQPPVPESYDAVVIFGGGMNVGEYKKHPWLRAEEEFISFLLANSTPLLGICLGGQMMAHLLGGRVKRLEQPEFGWGKVSLTEEGKKDPLLSCLPDHFMALEWHRYSFDVPAEHEVLALSHMCNQAFRAGEHQWGIQFHPEGGLDQTTTWLTTDHATAASGGGYLGEVGRDYDEVMTELRSVMPDWNQLGERLCRRWAALADASLRLPHLEEKRLTKNVSSLQTASSAA